MRAAALRVFLMRLVVACVSSGETTAQPRDYFLTAPNSQKYVVILGGIGAGETTAERFRQWSFKLYGILTGSRALASFKSAVSNPSVNQPYTGASRS